MEIFASREDDGIHIIKMPMIMDHTNIQAFETAKAEWLKKACLFHVMDLAHVVAIMPTAQPPLSQFYKELREQDKSLFSIHTPEELVLQLKRDGLFSIFNPVENLEVVHRLLEMKKAKKEELRSRILADVINSFTGAIDEIFKNNIGLDPISEPPYLKNIGEAYLFNIGARIDLELDGFRFSAAIQFDNKVFENVFDCFVDRDHQTSPENLFTNEDDLKRITKKILNPIFNLAKLNLKEKNKTLSKQSLPEFLFGENLYLHKANAAIVVEFLTAAGAFQLEVAIR